MANPSNRQDARTANRRKQIDILTVESNAAPTSKIDAEWVLELATRWKLAEVYVSDLAPAGAPTGDTALKRVICHDVPVLVRELIRLRPELG
jgi:hypothetical protein